MGSSSGKSVAIVSMIIAVFSIVLAGYSTINLAPINTTSNLKNTWYSTSSTITGVPTSVSQIPDMNLNITVNSGETVYILFNCYVRLGNSPNTVFYYVYVDGVQFSEAPVMNGYNSGTDTIGLSICLQHVSESFTPNA